MGKKPECVPCSEVVLHPCIKNSFKMIGNGNAISHTSELIQ
jgi:hypothetical protein